MDLKQPALFIRNHPIIILIALGLLAFIVPHPEVDLKRMGMPPSLRHPFGTSPYGQGLLHLTMIATIRTLAQACWASAWSLGIGFFVGVISAYKPQGTFDVAQDISSRLLDSLGAFLLLACLVAVLPKIDIWILGPISGCILWPQVSGVIRSNTIRLQAAPFVEAAIVAGAGAFHIFVRHILPSLTSQLIPLSVAVIGSNIAIFAALGFIGVGTSDQLNIGFLVYDSHNYIRSAPWYFMSTLGSFLGLSILLILLSRMSKD